MEKNWSHNNAKGIPTSANIYAAPVKIGNIWFLSTKNGLYTSLDGINWIQNPSIPTSAILWKSPVQIGSINYLGTYGQGLWTSQATF